jgi:hypothetical protein
MDLDQHRKYIHDMANSLSIVEASIARVLTLISRNHPEMTDEINRLKKADEYSKKSIVTLREFREHIHGMQKNQNPEV